MGTSEWENEGTLSDRIAARRRVTLVPGGFPRSIFRRDDAPARAAKKK
jgi:hypothetical protein